MRHHYWEWPVALYLFLGGMGGGIWMMAAILIFFVFPGSLAVEVALVWPCFLGVVWLGVGCLFLVGELGQPGVFLGVFFNSMTSIIGHGARLLSVCLIFGFIWVLSYLPWPLAPFLSAFRGFLLLFAGLTGFGIMVYTGVMLSTLKAHALWATPALPVLFTVSATSTACACIMLSAGWVPIGADLAVLGAAAEIKHLLHTVDIILICCELVVLLVMVLSFLGAGNPTQKAVAKRWCAGKTAPIFWGGMIFIGLICPLVLNIWGFSVVAAVLALIGGCLLRFLVVYSDDRAEIPGENRFYNKLSPHTAKFLTAWKQGENLY